ncbi:MAG: FkbM family methyltransferase [Pseudomonadota bacterium]
MKNLLSKASRRLGWNLVKNRDGAITRHHYAFQLNKLFALTKPTMIIDVGGNRGQFYDFIQRFTDFDGAFVTFEPIPELHQFLAKKSAGVSNWQVRPVALGSEAAELKLNVMKGDDFSSFLPPSQTSGWIEDQNQVEREVTVPVHRLDAIFEEITVNGANERIFLKMDTQGFDLEVFKGASGILGQVVAMQSEVAFQTIYDGMPDVTEALDTFRAAGFGVTAFSKVADLNDAAVEFDCLMVNQNRA